MARFILHLGYPKTGTTYLQRKIFSQLKDDWVVVTPEFENCGVNIKRLKHHLQQGEIPEKESTKFAGKDVLFSIEGFLFDALRYVEKGQFAPRSWNLSLKGLHALTRGFSAEAISIVLYVRRQDELLHSLYAESKTYHFAQIESMNDIDKYLSAVMSHRETERDPGHFYDFTHTTAAIRRQFPEASLSVRLYEDLKDSPEEEIRFWSRLVGRDLEVVKTYENKRQTDTGEKEADQDNLRFRLNRIKQRFIPNLKLPNWLSQLSERELSKIAFSPREKIVFPTSRVKPLLEQFAASNRQLWTEYRLEPEKLGFYLGEES